MADTGTELEPDEFVREVNRIHHDVAANEYEQRHKNIHLENERIWQSLLPCAARVFDPHQRLNILDFGAGTGFAAEQIVRCFGPERIAGVTLVEPSAAMREKACRKFDAQGVGYKTYGTLAALPEEDARYHIVCENSVLHHVPDPYRCLRSLANRVGERGVLILGQEPNRRFADGALAAINRWGRSVLPRGWRPIGAETGDEERKRVGRALLEHGIIRREISTADLGMLIDFWVPRPWHAERRVEPLGFDKDDIVGALDGFRLLAYVSYQHLGRPLPTLNRHLLFLDKTLRLLFPSAGQEFGLVLARNAGLK